MRLGAVAGGPHVGERGGHGRVDGDRVAGPRARPGARCERGVGAHADGDERHVGGQGSVGADRHVDAAVGPCIEALDRGARDNSDAVRGELHADERAKLGVDGGQDLRKLLDQRDEKAAAPQRVSHLEADVAGVRRRTDGGRTACRRRAPHRRRRRSRAGHDGAVAQETAPMCRYQ